MRINYKTHPVFEFLGPLGLKRVPWAVDDLAFLRTPYRSFFVEKFHQYKADFKSKIYSVSESFFDASQKASNSLIPLVNDIMINDTADFIVKGSFSIADHVVMYSLTTKQGDKAMTAFLVAFTRLGRPVAFMSDEDGKQFSWISQTLKVSSKEQVEEIIAQFVSTCTLVFMFSKYANVETVVVNAKSRGRFDGEKVLNETGLNITFLDSKWFKNIVREEGFAVRGHFRLQPKKKDGEWTRELIWINDFEKHGYHSKARILSNAITA